jgi:HK97 family phage major capsid protein
MEIKDMKIEDIEKRMAEIENEKEAPEADIEALTEEVRSMNERKQELIKAAEERQAALNAIVEGSVETEIKETFEEERKTMTNMEVRNSKEYIDAFANYIKGGKDTECRALLTENGGGSVPVPELVDEIVRTAWDRDEITKLVKKTFIKGNLKIGFEYSATGAAVHTEGAAAADPETLVLGVTELVPASIKKWIQISDEAMDLTGEAFLRYIYDELTYQIAKAAANAIVADIIACGTVSTTSGSSHLCAVPVVEANSIALGTVASAIAQLSDEANNPVVIMNKQTWASFKAVQYAGSYAVDPFEGLPVVFNNSLTAFSAATTGVTYAIVGDLGYGAQMNFPNGEEITIKVDELSLAERDLVKIVGREFVAHDVVAPKAFVKIAKGE